MLNFFYNKLNKRQLSLTLPPWPLGSIWNLLLVYLTKNLKFERGTSTAFYRWILYVCVIMCLYLHIITVHWYFVRKLGRKKEIITEILLLVQRALIHLWFLLQKTNLSQILKAFSTNIVCHYRPLKRDFSGVKKTECPNSGEKAAS